MKLPLITETILAALAAILMIFRINMDSGGRKASGGCEHGACKTIGNREIQGDDYGIVESGGGIMAVLAGGMGGDFGGKIASRSAVEAFKELFSDGNAFYNPQYYFRKAFHAANRDILRILDGGQGAASVGAVMVKDRKLYYAVVGNVKAAVYRNGELVPVTSGHTIGVLAEQKYREGKLTRQDAVSLLERHRLYNYVGQDGFADIEFFDTPINLLGGEYVVLLSDGMYEGVSWKNLEECLEKDSSCQEKALELTEQINRRTDEDTDNAGIVILRVR